MPPMSQSPRERPRPVDWVVGGAFVATLPAILWAVLHVRSDTSNVAHWLPQGTAERAAYDEFVRQFGIDDFLLVSWEGCTLHDERFERFAGLARERLAGSTAGRPLLERVVTSGDLVRRLTTPPLELSPAEAEQRLDGILLGRASQTACVVLHLTEAGKARNKQLVDEVERLAVDECGVTTAALHLGGSAFEAVSIDRESLASLKRYVVPSGLVVVVLALLCVRQLRLVLVMLLVSVYCQGLAVAVLHFAGGSLDALLIVMPTLVYVTTMSGALHLVNYYLNGVRQGEPAPSVWMLRHALFPCIGASVTTAIGLGSLVVSQVEPVRRFGFYAALNIMLALVVLLLCMPAALRLTGRWARTSPVRAPGKEWAPALVSWIERWHRWINGAALLLIVWALVGIGRLQTSLNLTQMFPPESQLVRNYAWLEQNIGPLISIELLVAFPRAEAPDLLEQLELVGELERATAGHAEVQTVFSVLTFLPPLPDGRSVRATTQRSVWRKRLESHREELQAEGMYALTEAEHLWRITARVDALAGHDYGALSERLYATADAALQEGEATRRRAATLRLTGITPVVYRAQRQILNDLFNSFVSAFALICPLMMLQLRSVLGGLVAMIPNVAPVALVFGGLGWSGIPVDIGVVLTASVGLGIAVDGTLHFVGWYRWRRRAAAPRTAALHSCFQTCAVAMTQTTAIVGLGLLVFALSSFLPTMRFAVLLCLLLLVALAGDLVLTPALLAGRLERFFAPSSPLEPQDPRPARRMPAP